MAVKIEAVFFYVKCCGLTVHPQLKPYLAKVKDHCINNSYSTLKNNFYNVNTSEIHVYFFLLNSQKILHCLKFYLVNPLNYLKYAI